MKAAIDKNKHWYVVRTNVKREAKAGDSIRKAGYDTYLPRRRVEVQHKRTNALLVKESPLMPRYLFVGMPRMNADFYRLRNCDGVECILGVDGRPLAIPSKQVEDIFLAEIDMKFDDTRAARVHRKEEAATEKENTERQFPSGQSVFVNERGNPFATFGGIVEEVTRSGKVVALIELFGRMTPVTFEARQLEPAV